MLLTQKDFLRFRFPSIPKILLGVNNYCGLKKIFINMQKWHQKGDFWRFKKMDQYGALLKTTCHLLESMTCSLLTISELEQPIALCTLKNVARLNCAESISLDVLSIQHATYSCFKYFCG